MGHLDCQTSWVTWEARDLLSKAESAFGPRDSNFEFLGVSFDSTGPRIRFSPCETRLCLELASEALTNPNLIRFQAAHEIIHVLAPTRHAPMLEEGLAVWFSLNGPDFDEAYRHFQLNHLKTNPASKHYWDALNVFSEMEMLEPGSIAKLRSQERSFARMTPSFVTSVLPSIPGDLAKRCCEYRIMR